MWIQRIYIYNTALFEEGHINVSLARMVFVTVNIQVSSLCWQEKV